MLKSTHSPDMCDVLNGERLQIPACQPYRGLPFATWHCHSNPATVLDSLVVALRKNTIHQIYSARTTLVNTT